MAKIKISEIKNNSLEVLKSRELNDIVGGSRRSLVNINNSFNTQLGINTSVIVQIGNENIAFANQFIGNGIFS
jgi:hypothetical protein